jgi:ribosomal protein S18 acetylase RimI-like enzyme
MASLSIREFRPADISFALTQTAREGWDNTAASFEVCLAHDPAGCFIAELDGQPAGMITTTRYARAAWIGHLIVPPEDRRQGIGEQLMAHTMQHLASQGVQTIRLEADPPGVNLYRRLGFVDEFESLRFETFGPVDTDSTEADPMTPHDLPEVAAFDAQHFGDDRGRLLELLFDHAAAGLCVRARGDLAGYLLVSPSTRGLRLGPWVASDAASARTLLKTALAQVTTGTIVLGVPQPNLRAVALLESFQFARTPSCRRMVHGPQSATGRPHNVYGIANGAMG